MPDELLNRADEILKYYENNNPTKNKNAVKEVQLAFNFENKKDNDDELRNKLKDLDVMNMTPIDALNYLYELKNEIKK